MEDEGILSVTSVGSKCWVSTAGLERGLSSKEKE